MAGIEVRATDATAATADDATAPEDPRHRGGPVPTADDLSVLHLHDRHSDLGLSTDDLLGIYRTILTARLLDRKSVV